MKKSATKHLFELTAAICVITGGIVLTGCSHNASKAPSITTTPVTAPSASTFDGDLTVYVLAGPNPTVQPDDNGLIPVTIKVSPASRNLAKEALDALASSKDTPLPPGTTIVSVVLDQGTGLATVDFSRQFKDRFEGGDTREAQVIESVLETLGQFPTIQNVQFLVHGQKIDSLGGNEDLDSPLPIVKNTAEAASGA